MSDARERTGVGAVVAYAAELEKAAARIVAGDPYARPYRPTPAAAKQLHKIKVREAVLALGPDPSEEAKAEARAAGAEAALCELRWRAGHADRVRREELIEGNHREQRLARIQRQAREEADLLRRTLTPGQRIDKALASMAVVAAGPGVNLDAKVAGSRDYAQPAFHGDPAGRGRDRAVRLARELERDAQEAQRRSAQGKAA